MTHFYSGDSNLIASTVFRSYIGIPVYFFLWLGYKLMYKTKVIQPKNVDLVTGLKEIEDEEQRYLAAQAALGPRTRWQRIWDAL